MRFLVFNIAVGLALVYLVNGGSMPTGGFQQNLADAGRKAEAMAASLQRKLTVADAPKPGTQSNSDGHGRDVIPSTPQTPPVSKPAQKPVQKPAPKKRTRTAAPPPPPPLAPAVSVPVRKLAGIPGQPKPKPIGAVAQRRAEVLAVGETKEPASAPSVQTPSNVSLKAGAKLMSAAERRRQLHSLAEDMEMLYLEKIGG